MFLTNNVDYQYIIDVKRELSYDVLIITHWLFLSKLWRRIAKNSNGLWAVKDLSKYFRRRSCLRNVKAAPMHVIIAKSVSSHDSTNSGRNNWIRQLRHHKYLVPRHLSTWWRTRLVSRRITLKFGDFRVTVGVARKLFLCFVNYLFHADVNT